MLSTNIIHFRDFVSTNPGNTQAGCRTAFPPDPQKLILKKKKKKNTNFLDITISKVLHDLHFSRQQPLKSADDQRIRIVNNKLMKLKKNTQEDTTL
jgi:hypothetical protein